MTVAVGDRIPPFEVAEVSAEKMKTIAALLGDPNPIHWDLDAVAALGMGGPPDQSGPAQHGLRDQYARRLGRGGGTESGASGSGSGGATCWAGGIT